LDPATVEVMQSALHSNQSSWMCRVQSLPEIPAEHWSSVVLKAQILPHSYRHVFKKLPENSSHMTTILLSPRPVRQLTTMSPRVPAQTLKLKGIRPVPRGDCCGRRTHPHA
jgi:hypothetical protein